MAQRVFVDVGGHMGASVATALEGGYRFDRIVSVEPDPDMVAHLERRFAEAVASGRLTVAPVGLADFVGETRLFGDNAGGGASVVATKFAADARGGRAIQVLDWPTFVRRYDLADAELYVKINAEGAEVAIIESMLAHGVDGLASLVVDFDIVKTPFGGWKKWRAVRRLRAAGAPFHLAENILSKHLSRPGLHNWMASFPALCEQPQAPLKTPLFQRVRVRWLEVVSAVGVRHDVLKRRR